MIQTFSSVSASIECVIKLYWDACEFYCSGELPSDLDDGRFLQ